MLNINFIIAYIIINNQLIIYLKMDKFGNFNFKGLIYLILLLITLFLDLI
jgi:hypothetical protein